MSSGVISTKVARTCLQMRLGAADANNQAYWVAKAESALKAAQHAFERERENQQDSTSHHTRTDHNVHPTAQPTNRQTSITEHTINTEGSIRLRRQRKR